MFQTLNPSTLQCGFQCASSGYSISKSQCGNCTDPNCNLCTVNNDFNSSTSTQQCGLCNAGYYLDLSTYKCVTTCPALSKAIITTNTHDLLGSVVQYCRPYALGL